MLFSKTTAVAIHANATALLLRPLSLLAVAHDLLMTSQRRPNRLEASLLSTLPWSLDLRSLHRASLFLSDVLTVRLDPDSTRKTWNGT